MFASMSQDEFQKAPTAILLLHLSVAVAAPTLSQTLARSFSRIGVLEWFAERDTCRVERWVLPLRGQRVAGARVTPQFLSRSSTHMLVFSAR
jgi:hypothetical protein